MAVDWNTVGKQVEQAVAKVLGGAWQNASTGASAQITALVTAGASIEQNKDDMKQAEYDSLKIMQKRAMDGVLQAYEGIAIDTAEQAAAAAWDVVTGALKDAYPKLALAL
jgi:hypothetical protein